MFLVRFRVPALGGPMWLKHSKYCIRMKSPMLGKKLILDQFWTTFGTHLGHFWHRLSLYGCPCRGLENQAILGSSLWRPGSPFLGVGGTGVTPLIVLNVPYFSVHYSIPPSVYTYSLKGSFGEPAAGSPSPAASSGRGSRNKTLWLYECDGVWVCGCPNSDADTASMGQPLIRSPCAYTYNLSADSQNSGYFSCWSVGLNVCFCLSASGAESGSESTEQWSL